MTALLKEKNFKILVFILIFILGICLIRTALLSQPENTDFLVYWKTAVYVLSGESAYNFSRDQLRCFKYPPWTLPFFLPLGIMPVQVAGIVFRLLNLYCIVWIWTFVKKNLFQPIIASVALLFFWGFLIYNIQTGQVTLLLMAGVWKGWVLLQKNKKLLGSFLFLTSLSAKVIQLIALVEHPVVVKPLKYIKSFFIIGILWMFLSLVSFIPYYDSSHFLFFNFSKWFNHYQEATLRVGADLGSSNQGLAGFFLALFKMDPHQMINNYYMGGVSILFLSCLYFYYKEKITKIEKLAICLAYAGILHPLAYSYNYIWVYPMAALSLDRCLLSHKKILKFICFISLIYLTVLSNKILGKYSIYFLCPSHRAVATVILSICLMISSKNKRNLTHSTSSC